MGAFDILEIHKKYMEQACYASNDSSCLKRKVGAVIVKDNSIISKGTNGGNPLFINCCNYENSLNYCYWKQHAQMIVEKEGTTNEVIKQKSRQLCLSICAEKQAIINAMKVTDSLNGADIYCTTYPCPSCAKMIRDMQINSVYYIHDFNPTIYICQESKRIFDEAKIKCVYIPPLENMGSIGTRTDYEYN